MTHNYYNTHKHEQNPQYTQYNRGEHVFHEKKSLFPLYLAGIITTAVILIIAIIAVALSFKKPLLVSHSNNKCPTDITNPTATFTLYQTVRDSRNQELQKLLNCGMDANQKTFGTHLIVTAITAKNLDTVNIILDHGGNPNIEAPYATTTPVTPLDIATMHNLPDIVETLINHGANINHQDKGIGWTALMYATGYSTPEKSYYKTVKVLLEHNANVNLKSRDGLTALDFTTNDPNIVNLLKAHGAIGKEK